MVLEHHHQAKEIEMNHAKNCCVIVIHAISAPDHLKIIWIAFA